MNKGFHSRLIVLCSAISLLMFLVCPVMAEESHPHGHDMVAVSDTDPSWQAKLKKQIEQEDTMEGRAGLSDKIDTAMNKLMKEIAGDTGHAGHASGSGPYQEMSTMQQMDRSFFLGPGPVSETVTTGGHCPAGAPRKEFDVTAINVEITLNQWGDYHPGFMYVLTENLQKVREEEKRNKEARTKENDPGAVSTGLQTDLIQPLTLRADQGDCVILTLRNGMKDEDVGLHIHGSSMIVKTTGQPATMVNPDSNVKPGKSQVFEWYIRPEEQEGAHMFHSHVGRESSSLGLIGAFMVEPMGAVYLDSITGKESQSGWQMMITFDKKKYPYAKDFREFTLFYHEIGDESFRPLNRHGEMIPQRDPNSDAYRPSARAINYRSEPFGINNLALQEKYFHFEDESTSYSAYMFGDIPTAMPRSYMGDPAKYRLIHGGGEVFHSHHPHGGTIRWLRQPKADPKGEELLTAAGEGPVKYPVIRTTSDRVDVEVIGPTEALDLQTECGSGLCQQLAGDFLMHCHVAHHYVAGMWSYWRVYNTLQTGNYPYGSTDIMPALQELPDRKGRMKPPVTSEKLVDRTVDWYDKKWHITADKTDWSKPVPDISIKEWVKMMLPPMGQPGHTSDEKGQIMAYDATVWDWGWEGNKAMGEPEMTNQFPFPKYKSPMPGKRPPILFDEKTGKLAWPHLKPHFGKRIPFARHHGPAPWLEPIHVAKNTGSPATDPGGEGLSGQETSLPAKPGEQGKWSLCPEGAGRKQYTIHFIETPITMETAIGKQKPIIDPKGTIYVLQEEEAAVRANSDLARPLVYRANVYDCVDVILKSEWNDNDSTNFQMSKINIHPHFIQFDNQASDGVMSGFSYEQSVRPFTMIGKKDHKGLPPPMNAVLEADTAPRSGSIKIKMGEGATAFHVGTDIMIGMHEVKTAEVRWIKSIDGDTVTFTEPLKHTHKKGEIASSEYVRYRYWVDADLGTVFWHDHALGATTWPHGGVGGLMVEPVGSTYHDPKTGKEIRSGPIADIHSTEPIGYNRSGSFREMVVYLHDTVPFTAQVVTAGNPPGQSVQASIDSGQTISFVMPGDILKTAIPTLNGGTHTTGGGMFFRAESLARRLVDNPEPSLVFSSLAHHNQDSATPMLRAYVGDTVVFRLLHVMMNESHTWHIAGHAFRTERYAQFSDLRNAYHVGIAERYDLVTVAGGAQQMAGDYLHFDGRASHLSEGSWGIMRVLDHPVHDLKPLPGHEVIPQSAKTVCPSDAPVKSFNVMATDRALKFNNLAPDTIEVDFDRKLLISNPKGKIYMLEGDKSNVSTDYQPMPLTLHVNVGDCIKINLKNEMKTSRASFSADMLAFDPKDSQGVNVGMNPGDQTIGPGERKTYTYYAPAEYGETAALVYDWSNILNNVRDGLFGGIIVGPRGSTYRDPKTGEDVSLKNAWNVDVLIDRSLPENAGKADYRDASLFFQEEDNIIGTAFMPYLQHIAGLTGVNYRLEPWSWRQDKGCEAGNLYTACVTDEKDPVTPTITAHAGDPVRIHVFGAFDEQNQVFSLEGHEFPLKPNMVGADMQSSEEFGGSENLDIYLKEGAGGPFHLPGVYVWQNHRMPFAEAGQWGYLRVLPAGDKSILPLNSAPGAQTTKTAESLPSVAGSLPVSMLEKDK
ncbi:MAG: multicopper oxidase domain-containing protein [Nitrospiria bacterium]